MGRKNITKYVYECEEKIKDELNEIDKVCFLIV